MELQRDTFAPFLPQDLRQYVASYNSISATVSATTSRVTKDTATKGEIAKPDGRRAPTTIEPWTQRDEELERAIIGTILHEADRDMPLFPERQHVVHVGEDLVRVDSEHAVLLFDADTLHKPASRILHSLLASQAIRTAVSLTIDRHSRSKPGDKLRPGKVSFPTHRNQVPNRPGIKRKRVVQPDHAAAEGPPLRRLGPADVLCVFENSTQPSHAGGSITVDTGKRSPELLLIKEAKAPHKLTPEMVEKAVGMGESLDTEAIMSGGFTGSEAATVDIEECRYWFAAVCTQLYNSMIDEGRLRYGIITTGVYYIFTSIDPSEPSILRYSVSKNGSEDASDSSNFDPYSSPILRLVALVLLAMHDPELPESAGLNHIWRGQGLVWATGTASFSDTAAGQTPQTESWREESGPKSDRSDSASTGDLASMGVRTRGLDQTKALQDHTGLPYPSPPPRGKTTSALGKRSSRDEANLPREDLQATKLPRLEAAEPTTTTLSELPPLPTPPRSSPLSSPICAQAVSIHDRAYCSTACLLALRRHDDSQPPCPNSAEHLHAASQITKPAQLRQLLEDQLERSEHRDHKFLWIHNSGYTQPMKVCLRSHGYVLFAKAFQYEEMESLQREARMYHRLRNLQGVDVPVCLGTIELPRPFYFLGVPYTGLLLLSHAGMQMNDWLDQKLLGLGDRGEVDRSFTQTLTAKVAGALSRIHQEGVVHRDIALRNVMLQGITRKELTFDLQLQLIDFERSRSKQGYLHHAERVLKLQGKDGRADLSAAGIGSRDFTEACVREMDTCTNVIAKWNST